MITFTNEVISHFKCSICMKWWSISDWKPTVYVWCPNCAKGDKPVKKQMK